MKSSSIPKPQDLPISDGHRIPLKSPAWSWKAIFDRADIPLLSSRARYLKALARCGFADKLAEAPCSPTSRRISICLRGIRRLSSTVPVRLEIPNAEFPGLAIGAEFFRGIDTIALASGGFRRARVQLDGSAGGSISICRHRQATAR